MVLARPGVRGDALHARVRGVVHALALLPVRVPHGVRVLLLELLGGDLLAKLRLPKQHRLLQRQPDPLEVQLQLPPPLVPQVVFLLHLVEQVLRAQRERLGSRRGEVAKGDDVAGAPVLTVPLCAVLPAQVALGERGDAGARRSRSSPATCCAQRRDATERAFEPGPERCRRTGELVSGGVLARRRRRAGSGWMRHLLARDAVEPARA